MGRRDFFKKLPSEITTDILSRLPLRSIPFSKCVCKSWLNLLNSDDFKIKPQPALLCLKSVGTNPTQCTIFEIEDEEEADLESHDLHYIPLTALNTPQGSSGMLGIAANGLFFLYSYRDDPEIPVYICNTITREYIVLDHPKENDYFEFCVSEISGQYKVICICKTLDTFSFQVYTLGTGIWRPIDTGGASGLSFNSAGHALCNGNLHWEVEDLVTPYFRICGFDIETECFTIFSPPPSLPADGPIELHVQLAVLRNCLCLSYTHDYDYDVVVIWMMKEYQVEESWTIEYKLSTVALGFDEWIHLSFRPIKVFKDGDILMLLMEDGQLIYYSNKTTTAQRIVLFNDAAVVRYNTDAMVFTPSLFSLNNFEFENVISF
ncbi:F-box protein CPR1-like [Salvia hispanica]|uniref:F-box protein CPR1-like n=1 Tax=Salvia hispanica TaxID=49212 RepID=UPI0020097C78|nr:F-box protein CPR1-like [Salvia hispanica]